MDLGDAAQSVLRMGQLAVVRREPAIVRRDSASGGWLHRYRAGVLVSPAPRGVPWNLAVANTRDVFFHGYHPVQGDIVVELGAEYGTETVTLSRTVGASGRVIAVEAHPATCRLLAATVAANALTNVAVLTAAVVGSPGPVRITDGASLSNTVLSGAALAGTGSEVEGITLDDLVARYAPPRIDLLKVNIEGAEGPALAGMAQSIALVRNAVVSCHDFKADAGAGEGFRTGAAVDAALRGWGFTVGRRADDPRPWVRDYRYARR